jgi:hypothetical protein
MEEANGWHCSQERALRFLVTLNMPAFEGRLVHQLTLEVLEARSVKELCLLMNRDEFIIGRHLYRKKNMYTQESEWEDRGDVVVNTAHIGKAVEFLEMEEDNYDNSQKANVVRTQYTTQGPRRPIRP